MGGAGAGVFEVGVKVSPSGEPGISFNLAAKGHTGAREGAGV